jgi:hypothetical protein
MIKLIIFPCKGGHSVLSAGAFDAISKEDRGYICYVLTEIFLQPLIRVIAPDLLFFFCFVGKYLK